MKTNQLKVGAALSYIMIFLNCAVNIFLTPLMLSSMGESDYGLYQLIGSFVGYIGILDFGLGNAIIRYVSQRRQLNDKKGEEDVLSVIMVLYFCIVGLVVLVGTVVYFNLGNIFSQSLIPSQMSDAKTMFIILLVNMAVTLPGGSFSCILTAYEKFFFTRMASIARTVLRFVMIIIVLRLGYGAVAVVVVDTLLNILIIFMNFSACKMANCTRIRLHSVDKTLLKDVVGYSFIVFLNLIVDQLLWKVNQTVIGIKLSTVAVAVYSIGMNFSSIFSQSASAVSGVFIPRINQMVIAGASKESLTNYMIKVGRIQSMVLLYVYIGFALLGRQFIKLWAGPGYDDAWITAFLVMTGLLLPLVEYTGLVILQALKKHLFFVVVYLFILVANVVLAIMIVNSKGIVGVAFITMLSLFIGHNIIINIYYHNIIGLNILRFLKELCRGILPSAMVFALVGALVINMMSVDSYLLFVVAGAVVTLIYAVCMYFAVNGEERAIASDLLKKVVQKK